MIVVYTAIFGTYDILHDIKLEEGCRAICFTDQNIKSDTWEIVRIPSSHRIYREIKIKPHKFLPIGWTKCIWIDGNLEFKGSILEFAKDKNGFWLMNHPDRNCIYEEGQRCKELGKDSPDVIDAQMADYVAKGYPAQNGLSATGVIVREFTKEICDFCNDWWMEVAHGSVRDQLSFNYVAWYHELKFNMFPFLEGFEYHYHEHKKRELEEKRIKKMQNRREEKLVSRRTAEYYKRYGHNENGNNSSTY